VVVVLMADDDVLRRGQCENVHVLERLRLRGHSHARSYAPAVWWWRHTWRFSCCLAGVSLDIRARDAFSMCARHDGASHGGLVTLRIGTYLSLVGWLSTLNSLTSSV